MHVLKVLFKIAWVMLASIFFLSFFSSSLVFAKHEELLNNKRYTFPMCESGNQFEFLLPTCCITMLVNIQAKIQKRKLHHIFPRRWVNWLVHLNESCMQRLYCLFYHSSQRVAHVDAVTGFHFKMFFMLGSMNFANAICLWTGAE